MAGMNLDEGVYRVGKVGNGQLGDRHGQLQETLNILESMKVMNKFNRSRNVLIELNVMMFE